MRSLIRLLAHLRTRRGFGVHSPFAFRFIADVINDDPHYGYYAYKDIDTLCPRGRTRATEMRRFFRLLAHCNAASVHAGSDPLYRATADLYAPASDSQSEVWVISCATDPLPDIAEVSSRNTMTLIVWTSLHDTTLRRIFDSTESMLTSGQTFTDGRSAIMVLSSSLPRQTYGVKI